PAGMDQPSDEPESEATGTSGRADTVTIIGCVAKETDVLGTGGIGSGNEFVLTNASMGAGAGASSMGSPSGTQSGSYGTAGTSSTGATSGTSSTGDPSDTSTASGAGTMGGSETSQPGSAAGTSQPGMGTSSASSMGQSAQDHSGFGSIYRLTGSKEGDFERLIGRRVEVIGRLERNAGAGATGTAGTTGGASAGTSIALGEIDVKSFREVSGSCAPNR
ncbi:MAG TPA: hypothetical protein VNK41_08655, partial [Vicinamibacterales bacterium]|nr:hypothetical protein [Vicinamibacterales bacterium]